MLLKRFRRSGKVFSQVQLPRISEATATMIEGSPDNVSSWQRHAKASSTRCSFIGHATSKRYRVIEDRTKVSESGRSQETCSGGGFLTRRIPWKAVRSSGCFVFQEDGMPNEDSCMSRAWRLKRNPMRAIGDRVGLLELELRSRYGAWRVRL